VRILNVIGSVDPRNGGTTQHVLTSTLVWKRHGHEAHILCLDAPQAPWVAQSPTTTFALGTNSRRFAVILQIFPILKYGYTPKLGRWLRRNAQSYDFVMLNGLWNFTSYGTWRALKHTNVSYFVFPHGMLDPWKKRLDPVSHISRLIFWCLFERKVLRDARGIFFASEEERRLAQSAFLRNDSKSYVVGFGAEDFIHSQERGKLMFLSKFPALRGRRSVLFLGRLHPKKGLDLLIEAFTQLADEFSTFDLIVAGPDELGMKSRLEKIAIRRSVKSRIHWTGMLTGDEKVGAFLSSEFFVLPSHQENFGIAVVEALALAVPVLLSKRVNIWREVVSAGAGVAVTDDVDGVREGLRQMCRLPQRELRSMKINARNCFLQHFNIENSVTELMELMNSLRAA